MNHPAIRRAPRPAGLTALLALTLLAAGVPIGATTVESTTLEDMTLAADAIVVARCVASVSEWHGRSLVTRVTMTVDDTWKGAPDAALALYLPGGMDGSGPVPIEVTVPGTPRMAVGENALLFLDALPPGTADGFVIHGLIHGYAPIAASTGAEKSIATTSGRRALAQVKTRVLEILARGREEVR